VSQVFPHLAKNVDDITFLMSMVSKTNVHGPASYLMNTGFIQPGFPSMGAWLSYGLGKLSDDLPTFVVLPDARGLPYNNLGNFSAGFLPARYQGTVVKLSANEAAIRYLFRQTPPRKSPRLAKQTAWPCFSSSIGSIRIPIRTTHGSMLASSLRTGCSHAGSCARSV